MVAHLIFVLFAGMPESFRDPLSQEELKLAHCKLKRRPVVSNFQDIESITIKIDITVEIRFEECLHRNFVTALVASESRVPNTDVVFDVTARQLDAIADRRCETRGEVEKDCKGG
jgi:hypothetical protein